MANWKINISEPETKKSYQLEVDQSKTATLIGKKIGEELSGDVIGLSGYSLKITGGTDKDGFFMHPSVEGMGRRRVLLSGPPGFHPKFKGERKRKTVRGNILSADIVQINVKVTKKGEKPLEEIVPVKPKEKKEEAKKEEKTETKPEELKAKEPKEEKTETKPKKEVGPKEEVKPKEEAKPKETEAKPTEEEKTEPGPKEKEEEPKKEEIKEGGGGSPSQP